MKLKSPESILAGSNFSKISNIVYSEFISKENYNKKNLGENIVLYAEKNYLLYKLLNFEINENSIIFCNTLTLKSLFKHLNKIENLNNIKLITHQTDIEINEKLFNLKPKCVSEWYSTNVNYDDESLISIPLGVGNDFQENQINTSSKFVDIKLDEISVKPQLYLNFKKSTNYSERSNLYEQFSKKPFVIIDEPSLSLGEYIEQVNKSSFILSPSGNGIDTHRIWEALYFGKIPITRFHKNFNSFDRLPILFVNDYKEVTEDLLTSFISKLSKNLFSLEMLDISYWQKKINLSRVEKKDIIIVKEFLLFAIIFKVKFNLIKILKSKYKIFKFYIQQLKKIPKKFF